MLQELYLPHVRNLHVNRDGPRRDAGKIRTKGLVGRRPTWRTPRTHLDAVALRVNVAVVAPPAPCGRLNSAVRPANRNGLRDRAPVASRAGADMRQWAREILWKCYVGTAAAVGGLAPV